MTDAVNFEAVIFDERGLIPAIVQDAETREVLTLAYMNRDSLRRTLETGETWFWSRSRNQLWHKGETSGHTQQVKDIKLDCDRDALIVSVIPSGPACHTGERTCFHNEVQGATFETQSRPDQQVVEASESAADTLGELLDGLYSLLEQRRRERPSGSYTTLLFDEGLEKILAKVSEEAGETVAAGRNETDQRLVEESSDLLYHLLVLLVERQVTLEQIRIELAERRKKSGLRPDKQGQTDAG
jgi:phosphoribosyl-ATP pyrophosphohydrolase/phosphoribosyl-AMP cyclohydrolase